MSGPTTFTITVDRGRLFRELADAKDGVDQRASLIGHRIVQVLLAGEVDFKDAIALEMLAGITMKEGEA